MRTKTPSEENNQKPETVAQTENDMKTRKLIIKVNNQ